jgi:pyruvate dehydrogenase E1 component alpha subunit
MAETEVKTARRDARAEKGDAGAAHTNSKGGKDEELEKVGKAKALELLRDMLLYRRFEEKAEEAYAIGKIGGFCHLHIGQEAACAGSISPLRPEDYVISAYREHTQAIAKGADPKAVMAELYGRVDGCSKGKGGSMHIVDQKARFLGGHGIVGGQIPLAGGIGFAIRYRSEPHLVLCFMGDAAVNQGAFHETLNMAAVWKLPCIFAVENNEYGMGTAFSRVSATPIIERADSYGIESSFVNGQDVIATYLHFQELAEAVRNGGGPRYVDIRTYRFKGHSMSDPVSGTYRSKEEVDKRVHQDDPITNLKDRLMAVGALTQEALEGIDKDVRAIVNEAADFADASPLPPPEMLYEHVYSEINEHGRLFVDGRTESPSAGGARG